MKTYMNIIRPILLKQLRLLFVLGAFMVGTMSLSIAQSFDMQCNGFPIPVKEQNDVSLSYELNSYKYTRLTYNGNLLTIEITASGFEFNNSDWDISPHSYGIKGTKKGSKLSFQIDRTGYLVVRFSKDQDFTKRLVIFVESPEKLPEGEFVDIVKTYQLDNTGTNNETEKIQQALNEISGSGKVLYFPDGVYKSFMLKIKSNTNIHLSKNARLIADASDLNSYLAKDDKGINRFILIKNAHNIHVTGLGTLDGNGTEILGVNDQEQKPAGMRLLFILNSKNVTFNGIILKDASRWNTHLMACEDITFRNCKMINNMVNHEYFGNLDGWDPDASKRVLIENCFSWASDDNVAIKCTGYGNLDIYNDVEDITVRGCVFLTKKTALKIGTETRSANFKNIVFENNDVIEADRVMGINVRDKATVDGVLFKNNRSEYNYPDRKQMGINIYITRRADDQPWTGKIQNVIIEDCTFEQKPPNKIQISRVASHTTANDLQVTFKNLTIANKKLTFLDPNYFNISKCNGVINFE